ncbi:MAG TPA: hypothetical protein VKG26_00020 [Bacteroidia bacterium]|nr:hypothetical protein [Bacteroidia bacterium]
MSTNNLDGVPTNRPNGSAEQTSHDSIPQVNGTLDAKTGGQMNGGVIMNTGNRIQAENQEGTESSQGD